jgi:hypothetical protein
MTKALFSISAVALVLASVGATRGLAQTLPFPMTVTGSAVGEVRLEPRQGGLAQLARLERVVLTGVPLPGGGQATLTLRRVELHLAPDAVHVDGVPEGGAGDPTLSLWTGEVAREPGSQAFLAFSSHGSRGWFGRPGRLHHLLAQPGPNGDWSMSRCRLVTAEFVTAAGPGRALECQVLIPSDPPQQTERPPMPVVPEAGPLPYYDAPISFETDYEFYALFNDLGAAQAYAFALIGAVSDRYREQNGVIFTLPYVGFHTTNNDPWTSNDCSQRLSEFRSAWRNGGAPVRAQLYHMISGVKVSGCGGVAYLNVICNQSSGFGMSAHINSNLTFPPVQGPLTWDFFVLAHELGHQFGSNHTHSYNPPIDGCASGNCSVVPNGTIMSYCHTCPGGMNNINLMFHPRVAATIRSAVLSSCLQPFHGVITADRGFALAGSNGTPVQDVSYSQPAVRIDVTSAPASAIGAMIFGFAERPTPFLGGGTLVPTPDVAIPITTNASGDAGLSIPTTAPYPAGVLIWVHSWFDDPSGPNRFAASNATRAELIKP